MAFRMKCRESAIRAILGIDRRFDANCCTVAAEEGSRFQSENLRGAQKALGR